MSLIDPATIAAIKRQQPAPDTAQNLARSRAVTAAEWRQAWGRSSATIAEVVQEHLTRDDSSRLGAQLMDRMLDLIAYGLSVAVDHSPTARRTIRNKCEEVLALLAQNLEDTIDAGVAERLAAHPARTPAPEDPMPTLNALERTSLCLYARAALNRPDLTQADLGTVPASVRAAWQADLPTPADQRAQVRAAALSIVGRAA